MDQEKEWQVIFYPSWDAPPETYSYWNKDKDLAIQHFNFFKDTRNDPEYPSMYRKIELRLKIDHLHGTVDEILFPNSQNPAPAPRKAID